MEQLEAHAQTEVSNQQALPQAPSVTSNAGELSLGAIAATLQSLPPEHIRVVLQQLDPRLLLDALQSSLPEVAGKPEGTVDPESEAPAAAEAPSAPMRVLKSGKLIYNNSMSVVDCQIREISENGCKIRVENSMGIPEHPVLQILDGKRKRQCQVAWKKLEEIGLEFID